MAGRLIKGETQNLQQLFEHNIYTIDYYQREYSWPAQDVRRLVTDLHNEFHRVWVPTKGRRPCSPSTPTSSGRSSTTTSHDAVEKPVDEPWKRVVGEPLTQEVPDVVAAFRQVSQ
jgi:hypothetical protein